MTTYFAVAYRQFGKTSPLHAYFLYIQRNRPKGASSRLRGSVKQFRPYSPHSVTGLYGVVVGAKIEIELERFDPATGSTASIGLAKEGVPVRDGAEKEPHVNKVERVVAKQPRLQIVVGSVDEIHGGRLGMHGCKICTNDVGISMTLRKVSGVRQVTLAAKNATGGMNRELEWGKGMGGMIDLGS